MVWIFSVLSALEENKSLTFLSQKKDENTELSKCLTWQLGGSLGHLHCVSKSPASDCSFLPMCAAESSRQLGPPVWEHRLLAVIPGVDEQVGVELSLAVSVSLPCEEIKLKQKKQKVRRCFLGSA